MMSEESLQLPPAAVTNEQLYQLLQQLHTKVSHQGQAAEDSAGELARLRADMDIGQKALKAEIDQVLQPWKAARMLGNVLKWFAATIILLSAAAAAVVGAVDAFKAWVRG